jgi:hypothetical protein
MRVVRQADVTKLVLWMSPEPNSLKYLILIAGKCFGMASIIRLRNKT